LKIRQYILLTLISAVILLTACEPFNNPNSEIILGSLKSETKIKVNPTSNSRIALVWKKEYDKESHLIKHSVYDDNGILKNLSTYSYSINQSTEIKLEYDDDGNLLNKSSFKYDYDNNGNVIKKTVFNELGDVAMIFEHIYDVRGNLLKTMEYDSNLTLIKEVNIIYRYNSQGHIIERTVNPDASGNMYSRDSLFYHANNRSVDVFNLNSSGIVENITTFYYDTNGFIVSELISNSKGDILQKFIYEYEFY